MAVRPWQAGDVVKFENLSLNSCAGRSLCQSSFKSKYENHYKIYSILILLGTDNVDFESKAYSLFTVEKNYIQRELK